MAQPRSERFRKGPTGGWRTRTSPRIGEELGDRARKTSEGAVPLRTVLESTLEFPAAEG